MFTLCWLLLTWLPPVLAAPTLCRPGFYLWVNVFVVMLVVIIWLEPPSVYESLSSWLMLAVA